MLMFKNLFMLHPALFMVSLIVYLLVRKILLNLYLLMGLPNLQLSIIVGFFMSFIGLRLFV